MNAHGTELFIFKNTKQVEKTFAIDFNNDGLKDLISFSLFKKKISLYAQNTDGTFSQGSFTYLYQHPLLGVENIYFGLFDEDDELDLIVVYESQFVSFYKGMRPGEFVFHSEYEIPFGNKLKSTSGDLNGDGKLEVIVSPKNFESNRLSFFVFSNKVVSFNEFPFNVKFQLLYFEPLLNKANKANKASKETGLVQNFTSFKKIVIGNIDGNLLKDVVLLDAENNRIITILIDRKGKYVPHQMMNLSFKPYSIGLIKIDHDYRDDLIVTPTSFNQKRKTKIYLTRDQKFQLNQDLEIGVNIEGFILGKFSSRKKKYIIFSSQVKNMIYIYEVQRGTSLLKGPVGKIALPFFPNHILSLDMDGDGLDDIIVSGKSTLNSNLHIYKKISIDHEANFK